jgi:DNA-binding transcriptional ArsR family regulator
VPEPLPEHPSAEDIRLTDILRALADPNRLKMLIALTDGEYHSCGPDSWSLGLQKSTISHHIKTLRQAGLIEQRVVWPAKSVRLRRAVLDSRFPGLIAGVTSAQAAADVDR